jgi:single-stranded DNA-binding protein
LVKLAQDGSTRNTEIRTSDTNSATLTGAIDSIIPISRKEPGKVGCRFLIAVTYVKKDGVANQPQRFNVVCWDDQAVTVIEAGAGARVRVEGSLRRETWKDRNTGATRYDTSILCSAVEVIQ